MRISVFLKKESHHCLVLLILVIGLVLRVIDLDITPLGFLHDEMDLAVNAKSFILTGSDQSNHWTFYKLEPALTAAVMGELVPLLNVPVLLFTEMNIFTSRLTMPVFGVFSAFFLYLIAKDLFKNQKVSLIALGLYAVNPWAIMSSRINSEVTASLFFYLLTFYLLLRLKGLANPKEKLQKIWLVTAAALVSLFLAYYTYHGLKFIAPVFVSVVVLWIFTQSKQYIEKIKLPLIAVVLVSFTLFASSLLRSNDLNKRTKEIVFLNLSKYETLAGLERRIGVASPMIEKMFSNKYFSATKVVLENYGQVFSPLTLFIDGESGESSGFYALQEMGYFYFFEIITISIGFFYLINKKKSVFYLLFPLLLVSPLPTVIHEGFSMFFRSSLMLPVLTLVSAYGMFIIFNLLLKSLKSQVVKKSLYIGMLVFVVINLSYFTYIYYFYYPVNSESAMMFDEQLLNKYVKMQADNQKITILTLSPYDLFRGYLFLNNEMNKSNIRSIQETFNGKSDQQRITYKNIVFSRVCQDFKREENTVYIVDAKMLKECKLDQEAYKPTGTKKDYISLASLYDNREYYRIFNDTLCMPMVSKTYVYFYSKSDLRLANVSGEDFCRNWLVYQGKLENAD